TDKLYDANELTRISQSIILGIGGAKLVEKLGGADIYHLNEGHGLPAFYYLKDKGVSKDHFAFTTHTPEKAGNEERDGKFLNRMGFFGRVLDDKELTEVTLENGNLNYTVSALRLSKKSNAVSKLHARVATDMWKDFEGVSEIIPITNAQNQLYWQDSTVRKAFEKKDKKAYVKRKLELKKELLDTVANQTGKIFDPKALTIVWARRFAGYKRADLLLYDLDRLERIINNQKYSVQIIWSGKPYPRDFAAISTFDHLISYSKYKKNLAVLIGYEMALSKQLKTGSDIWLNNPRITREASGTSGMTAAMNGSVNVSTFDGWIPEFAADEENCFVLPPLDHTLPVEEQDKADAENLYKTLENKVIPIYYNDPDKWNNIVFKGMEDVIPEFTSRRMAAQYYQELY
ncbi:MAG: alpha-glucan family phosphorylase, partial [Cyclobacteriaceae bacterium]|nr:alpha-glucan family phosphorylase [Cyclobacteriaceae bacterium HetDA_MAG_MS6]